jgi:NADH-quinone oxidoreductase subunit N
MVAIPAAPLLTVLATSLALFGLALVLRGPSPWPGVLATIGLGAALVTEALVPARAGTAFGGLVVLDASGHVAAIVIIGAALAAVLAAASAPPELSAPEYYALIAFTAFGALVLAWAADLLIVFLGLEATSIPLYALVAWRRSDGRGLEAALKFFLLGAFATAIMIFGMSLVVGASGTSRLADLGLGLAVTGAAGSEPMVVLAFSLVAVGLAFKLGVAPLHFWVIDAVEGSTPAVAGLLTVVPKIAALAALIRFFVGMGRGAAGWTPAFAALALLGMAVGNLGALRQRSAARLLGYSSVAQTGFVLIGLAVATAGSVSACMTYFAVYAIAGMGAFLVLAALDPMESGELDCLAGLGARRPWLAFALALFMLSLVGIPPVAGFFGKFAMLAAAVRAGHLWLALAGLLFSALSLAYYGAVLREIYLAQPDEMAPIDRDRSAAHGLAAEQRPQAGGLTVPAARPMPAVAVAALASLTMLVALAPGAVFVRLFK